jgi:hypothetical protein
VLLLGQICAVKFLFLAMTMDLVTRQHFVDEYVDQMVGTPISLPFKIVRFENMMIAR